MFCRFYIFGRLVLEVKSDGTRRYYVEEKTVERGAIL